MRLRKFLVLGVVALGLVSSPAKAQDLQESLESMLKSNAQLYLQPFVDGFGSGMNSGWYYKSSVHKFLGFDLSVRVAGIQIADDQKTFDWVLSDNNLTLPLSDATSDQIADLTLPFSHLYLDTETETATLFGDQGGKLTPNHSHIVGLIEEQYVGTDPNKQSIWDGGLGAQVTSTVTSSVDTIPLPGGFNLSAMPVPIVQAAIGLPMGTELSARFFPEQDLGDMGKFSFYGGGLRVNLDQFIPIPLFPVDITAGAFYQQMKMGDIITATNLHYGLQVGKSINLLIFGLGAYVDAGMDASSIDVAYQYDSGMTDANGDPIMSDVSFTLDGEGGPRFGAGIFIKPIPFINISAAYSQTSTNQVATLGLNIGMR